MKPEAGKYYTLDVDEFRKYTDGDCCGIASCDIEIFKNNVPHKCIFSSQKPKEYGGQMYALYFEGQKSFNSSGVYGKNRFWFYHDGSEELFKEYNNYKQEEMEV